MKRKVNFPDQSFDIAVSHLSATALSDTKNRDLLNQFSQIITNKTTRDLHDSKCTVSRLGDVADAQNVWIQLLKSLTQFVRWWRLEVWWEGIAVGHG